jgi:5-methylthioadenosine/S-adenosylhomocysteine deaminase
MEAATFDLLLTRAHVLSMDAEGSQHLAGYVAIAGNKIAAVGAMSDCPEVSQATTVIDCTGCIVMPGLINCHTHLPMVYFRGMADDLPLMRWLTEHIWPAENKHLSPDFVYQATLLAAAECIKSGVTCVNDMYIFAADIARACEHAGLRAYVGEGVINNTTPSAAGWQDGLRLTRELIAQYKGHPMITPTVCPHAPYTTTPEILQALHGVAQEHDLLYHIHVHETEQERDLIEWGRTDESPVHQLKYAGVLGPRMVAVHAVWIDDHDMRHMREHDCGVAHCPTSNMKLGSGIAPVGSMVEAEIAVGVGTDGAASNNNLNLWEEIHLASLGAKAVYKNPEIVPARTALGFATSGAAALLRNDRLGVIAAGNLADVIVVEKTGLHLAPSYPRSDGIYGQLAYSAQAADVRDTIVAGKMLMRNRVLSHLDEDELKAKAQEWVDKHYA